MAILTQPFPHPHPRERARAIGAWGAAAGLRMAAGPILGGLLAQPAGWRSAFRVNVPIGLAALLLTTLHMPESRAPHPRRPGRVERLTHRRRLAYGRAGRGPRHRLGMPAEDPGPARADNAGRFGHQGGAAGNPFAPPGRRARSVHGRPLGHPVHPVFVQVRAGCRPRYAGPAHAASDVAAVACCSASLTVRLRDHSAKGRLWALGGITTAAISGAGGADTWPT
ncbi:MFS transporter [Streptomyces sp. NPDC049949]|uniref:MFS transporter n=1 Tax=Streptomyces sp. NPDC049949 TaxID=3154627 RepID=UPI00342EF6E6